MRTVVAEADAAESASRTHSVASTSSLRSRVAGRASRRRVLACPGWTHCETESALRAGVHAYKRLERQEHELAARPSAPDQTARIVDDRGAARSAHPRSAGRSPHSCNDVTTRIDGLEASHEGLVGRDELGATIAEQAGSLGAELDAVRAAAHALERNLADRIGSLAERSSVDAIDERVAAAEERNHGSSGRSRRCGTQLLPGWTRPRERCVGQLDGERGLAHRRAHHSPSGSSFPPGI